MLPQDGEVVWLAFGGYAYQVLVIGREWPAAGPPVILALERTPDGNYLPGALRVPIANVFETEEAAIAAGRSR